MFALFGQIIFTCGSCIEDALKIFELSVIPNYDELSKRCQFWVCSLVDKKFG